VCVCVRVRVRVRVCVCVRVCVLTHSRVPSLARSTTRSLALFYPHNDQASGLAQAIDDERGGTPERETYHDGQSLAELAPFWKALGGGPPNGMSIKTAAEGGSDEDVDKAPIPAITYAIDAPPHFLE
jgi:hypothetical protein